MKTTHRFLLGSIVSCSLGMCCTTQEAITFLNHFNDASSFDINPANGDYSAGTGTATPFGAVSSGTGFFPGSSPTNGAFNSASAGRNRLEYPSFDGNVLTGITTGGITIGTWFKLGGGGQASELFVVGAPNEDWDMAYGDVGYGGTNKARLLYRNDGGGSVVSALNTSQIAVDEWNYLAGTWDLTNQTMKLYTFNSAGTLVASPVIVTGLSIPSIWEPGGSLSYRIKLGDYVTGSLLLDEFSIDNTVLSQSDLQQRVNSMVAGNQLDVPEPASIGVLALACLPALARSRRSHI